MAEFSLPESWASCTVESLGNVQTGNTPSKSNPEFFGGDFPMFKPSDLDSNEILTKSTETLTDAGRAQARFIPRYSTYVTCIGATIGKTGFVGVDGTCNQQINTISPYEYVIPKWVYYLMISSKMQNEIKTNSSSTTLPILNKSKFMQLNAVLAPLAEQKVIAEKLDTLLAQVDNTKARLERIPEILKRFRQSVLAAAVSGKLTEEWRGKPIDWVATNLSDCTLRIGDGLHGTPTYSEDGDYYFVNGNNLINGSIVIKDTTKKVDKSEYQKHKRELGDNTLLVSINGTIGNLALFRNERVVLGKSACYLNFNEKISREFGYVLLSSQDFYQYAHDVATGATIKNVPLKGIRNYTFLLPSIGEQTEIVRRVEELFAFADRIEHAAQAALSRVNNLTQSILAKAFRGELTLEWRAANPELISGENSAEALLARIKAERAKLSQTKKGRGKSVEN